MTTTLTKTDAALKVLRKNTWVSREKIVAVTGENDLRSVRRLREKGHLIDVRKNGNGIFQYKRNA